MKLLTGRTLLSLVLSGALVVTAPVALRAQPKREPTRAELEERIRRLEAIIERHGLDREAPPAKVPAPAARAPEGAKAPEAAAPVDQAAVEAIVDERMKKQKLLAGWAAKDGFHLRSSDGDFKMRIGGYLQVDTRTFPNNGGDTGFNNIYLRRVRPTIDATLYEYLGLRIQPDFGLGEAELADGFLEMRYWPQAQLRAGKFKPPFSLERLQSGSEIKFVERSIANNLTPNRDVGVQLAGELLDGVLAYQIGVFNGVMDNASGDGDVSSEKEFAGRVFAHPAKKSGIPALAGLGVGVAGTYGDLSDADDLSGFRYRTPARSTYFDFDTPGDVSIVADGDRHRVAPQAYWFWGPFGAMGEYVFSVQGARRTDPATGEVTRASFDNRGWLAQASYVLTGEDAAYKNVVPRENFDPRNGRWGAFEVAARGSMVAVDDEAFDLGFASRPASTDGAESFGASVNWYWNRNFKVMLTYERTWFDDPVEFGDALRDHEDVILTRFQILY